MARAVRAGEICGPEEMEIECFDGTRKFILNYARPIGHNGSRNGAVAVNVDITDRKRAEEALRHSEERFAKAFQASPDGMVISRIADGTIYEVNEAYLSILGLHRAEVIGRSTLSLNIYSDLKQRAQLVEVLRRDGRLRDFEISVRHSSGAARIISVSSELLLLNGESLAVSLFRDITDLKRAEAALRESEEHARRIIDNTVAFVGVMTPDGTLIEANATALRVGGLTREDVVGRKFWDCYWWSYDPQVQQQLSEAVARAAHGEVVRYDVPVRMAGGSLMWIDFQIAPLRDDQGCVTHLIPSAMNIMERRAAEEAVRAQRTLLQTVVDNIPVLLCIWDKPLQRFQFNRQLRDVLGWTEADAAEGDFMVKVYPDAGYRQDVIDFMVSVAGGWRDFVCRAKDGTDVDISWANVRLADGTTIGVGVDIRARKAAEEQARRGEQRHRELAAAPDAERAKLAAVIQNLPVGVGVTDTAGATRSLNKAGLALHGFSSEQEMLRGLADYAAQFELRGLDGNVTPVEEWPAARALRGDYVRNCEFRLRNLRAGSERVVSYDTVPVCNSVGEPILIVHLMHDLTARKQAEGDLREKEHLYRQILESIPGMVFTTRADGYCDYQSRQWVEYTGVPLAEHLGDGWNHLLHPDDRARAFAAWRTAVEKKVPYDLEYRVRRYDGSYEWFKVIGRPIVAAAGEIARWFGVALNIEALKMAEAALRERAEELERLLEVVPAAVWVADNPQCQKIVGNRRANEFYEAGAGENVSASTVPEVRRFFAPDGRELSADELPMQLAAATNREIHECEIHVEAPSGRRIAILGNAVPLRDTQGAVRGCIGAFIDITARKELEAQRDALLESERAARTVMERLSRTKDEFLSVITHELRTPLATILGWSQMLRGGKLGEEETREALDAVLRGSTQLKQLIDDLLDVSRIASGKLRLNPAPVDFAALAHEAVSDAQPRAQEAGIRLQETLPEAPALVMADMGRLRQVIANLLANAFKFTPTGGQVHLRVRLERARVVLVIADTGIGIAPDVLPRLFERFRQADNSITRRYAGLGLGLTLVKEIVELHSGQVRAESAGEGQGATFIVELPRLQAEAAAEHGEVCEVDLTGIRVLAVDDDPAALSLAARLLEERGAIVTRCASAAQALAALEAEPHDVLVSDISMPDTDGYALLRQVRSLPDPQRGSIPAVAVTAFAREEDERRSLQVGYQAHLSKPVNPAELCAQVRQLALARD